MFAPYEPEIRGHRDERTLVVSAGLEDLASIVTIAATRGPLPKTFEDSVQARVEDPAACVLVASVPGVTTGWAMATRWPGFDDCPEGLYVSALTVVPEYRRRGIAERLLGELMVWAASHSTALGSVVNAQNQPSIVLHQRLGFTEVARGASIGGIAFDGGLGLRLTVDLVNADPGAVA